MQTESLGTDPGSIDRAAEILRNGGVVAFPTETVYGLGADARNGAALEKIFKAKDRPLANPLIVHVAGIRAAERIAEFDGAARRAADAFWPGPLTLLLPERPDSGIDAMAAAGQPAIGVRVPSNPTALRLLEVFGFPVAAPSANLSNRVSPTRAVHVLEDLGGRINAVVDGGDCVCGLESTILAPSAGGLTLLRPGAVTRSEIRDAIGAAPEEPLKAAAPKTPGRQSVHYSPRSRLRIQAAEAGADEVWIGFGPEHALADLNLSPRGNLREAAANLYAALRQADRLAMTTGRSGIAVAPVPAAGIGESINDRLTRAAGDPDKA